jgi:hypothetical protein
VGRQPLPWPRGGSPSGPAGLDDLDGARDLAGGALCGGEAADELGVLGGGETVVERGDQPRVIVREERRRIRPEPDASAMRQRW